MLRCNILLFSREKALLANLHHLPRNICTIFSSDSVTYRYPQSITNTWLTLYVLHTILRICYFVSRDYPFAASMPLRERFRNLICFECYKPSRAGDLLLLCTYLRFTSISRSQQMSIRFCISQCNETRARKKFNYI